MFHCNVKTTLVVLDPQCVGLDAQHEGPNAKHRLPSAKHPRGLGLRWTCRFHVVCPVFDRKRNFQWNTGLNFKTLNVHKIDTNLPNVDSRQMPFWYILSYMPE